MKKIYFVRHGQSEGNSGPIRQTAETPLTEKGREQAQIVAKRCKNIPTELMVCSTMVRTRQTADAILAEVPQPVEYSDLFVERRRTSDELGKPKDDPKALEVEKVIVEHFAEPGFRYSDEENFDDLKERAKKALEYLANRPEETILVVSHGFFMRVLMSYVVFGDELTGKECQQFIRKFETENTSISVIEGMPVPLGMRWSMWIWNDHAHLG
ncbi:MAG TPA: histidine phosphatase family protein [Candidatus Paceibacterota bacterium]|jgi:probable phosphoglycerate mutase|nr:histidine phosphatase family protein [Candidatus Paceibacterota bacterium]